MIERQVSRMTRLVDALRDVSGLNRGEIAPAKASRNARLARASRN